METLQHTAGLKYELKELLGQGSSGCVFRAVRSDQEGHIRHEVAIKILNSKTLVLNWQKEFQSLVEVRSRHCVRVFGFEWIQERPALVLELVDGVTIGELKDSQLLSSDEWLWLGQEIEFGLRDLSMLGLSHGDLSPQNIMVTKSGDIRLLDFGWGNFSSDGWRLTPQFAAPEVLNQQAPNFQSDLWSLGQILKQGLVLKEFGLDQLCSRNPLERKWTVAPIAKPQTLSPKIQSCWQHKQSGQRTQEQCSPQGHFIRLKRPSLFAFGLFLSFSLVSGAADSGRTATPIAYASLRVRSQFSVEFSLNGRFLGFAPLDLPSLPLGRYEILWKRPHQEQKRTLTLRAGDHILIDDHLFERP